jgi:transposase
MTAASLAAPAAQIILGVDTHTDIHVAVALDLHGRKLGTYQLPTTSAGYDRLLAWARALGPLGPVAVEGTGSYGAGLARHLRAHGVQVLEADRPNRQTRRARGKSDPIDAETAARALLAGTLGTIPKTADGQVESLRLLRTARQGALKARTQAINQLHGLLITAPEPLRQQLRGLSMGALLTRACRWHGGDPTDPAVAAKLAIRSVARRYRTLTAELADLERDIATLARTAAPTLLALPGVGPETATALLVAAGDNPDRLRSEATFASLCGVAPIPASSGKTTRHRLNRGGNRDANRALFVIALTRMSHDQRTRYYVARRTAEGCSKREIMRCLKRYIAREIYQHLTPHPRPCST